MPRVGIIFCGVCNKTMVDSGFTTASTLKCCECGNENKFKIVKINLEEELIQEAIKDAHIND